MRIDRASQRGALPTPLRLALTAAGALGATVLWGLAACTSSPSESKLSASPSSIQTMGSVSYNPATGVYLWDNQLIGTLLCTDWNDPRMEGTFAERVAFMEEKCTFTTPPETPLPADPCAPENMSFSVAPDGQSYTIDKCVSLDGQDPYLNAEVVWHTVPDWSTRYDAECYIEEATGRGCCNFYVDIDPSELSACDAVYPGLRDPSPPGDGGPIDGGPIDGGPDGGPTGPDGGPTGPDGGPTGPDGGPWPDAGTPDAGPVADAGPPYDAGAPDGGAGEMDGGADPWPDAGTGGGTYGALSMAAVRLLMADPPVPPGPGQPGPPPSPPPQRANIFMQWAAGILLGAGTIVTPFNPEIGDKLIRTARQVVKLIEAARRGNNQRGPQQRAPEGAGPPGPPPPLPPGTRRQLEERGGRRPPPETIPPRPPQVLPPNGRPITKPEQLPNPPVRPPLRPPRG